MAQKKRAQEIDAFVAKPDPAYPVVLVYGPNGGLVAERARVLARAGAAEPEDPFQLIRLDGDEIAGDPLRLADEANTIGFLAGSAPSGSGPDRATSLPPSLRCCPRPQPIVSS